MIPARTSGSARSPEARSAVLAVLPRARHAMCFRSRMEKNVSYPVRGSVDFSPAVAKAVLRERDSSDQRPGSIHRAWRNGHRKRTRVRVACGDAIRPPGVGALPSHGHFGRSIVRRESPPHVVRFSVLEPGGEPSCHRGHLSSGPRLPAAALTHPLIGPPRVSAPADGAVPATRRRGPSDTRAPSSPSLIAGSSGTSRRRTHDGPGTRRHGAEEASGRP